METRYTSEKFINDINKIHTLYESGVYTESEYNKRKQSIINDVSTKGIKQPIDDFLVDILVLKSNNLLGQLEISEIGNSLSNYGSINSQKQIKYGETKENTVGNNYHPKPVKRKSLKSKIILYVLFIGLTLTVIFALIKMSNQNSIYEEKDREVLMQKEEELRKQELYEKLKQNKIQSLKSKYEYLKEKKVYGRLAASKFLVEIQSLGFKFDWKYVDEYIAEYYFKKEEDGLVVRITTSSDWEDGETCVSNIFVDSK